MLELYNTTLGGYNWNLGFVRRFNDLEVGEVLHVDEEDTML